MRWGSIFFWCIDFDIQNHAKASITGIITGARISEENLSGKKCNSRLKLAKQTFFVYNVESRRKIGLTVMVDYYKVICSNSFLLKFQDFLRNSELKKQLFICFLGSQLFPWWAKKIAQKVTLDLRAIITLTKFSIFLKNVFIIRKKLKCMTYLSLAANINGHLSIFNKI